MSLSSHQSPESTRLSIVIVNYQSWPDVLELVSLLAKSPAFVSDDCEILVIDNASPGPIPAPLLEPNPGIRLLIQPQNGGFASGVNAGWRASRGPWILVLNPDVIPSPDLIEGVLGRISSYGDRPEGEPGIVGFGLGNPDGSRQPSVGAFPGLLRTVWEQLIPRVRRKYQPEWRVRPGPVDWVTGACMLLNSRMLEAVGGMDQEFFLYYEKSPSASRPDGWDGEWNSTPDCRSCIYVLAKSADISQDAGHHPAQQAPLFPEILARLAILGPGHRREARSRIRGAWCRIRGKHEGRRAWRAIATIATGLDAGTLEGARRSSPLRIGRG